MIYNFQAYELAVRLYRESQKLVIRGPLKDQLERATSSVVLNLSEGSAKPTLKDKNRFYAIAFGSVREIQAIFDLLNQNDPELLKLTDRLAACVYRLTYRKPK